MSSLRVLITNISLSGRSGTEMYVHDLAKGLLARGHAPVIYAPQLGPTAYELQRATVQVVDDLGKVGFMPDVIHGHHTLATLTAMLYFPQAPAIYVCHDWSWEHDLPPKLTRIRRYLAVDHTVRDRLVLGEGIPESATEVVYNGVDLRRFRPRDPLPESPKRALVFSHYVTPEQLFLLRTICRKLGIQLDAWGSQMGSVQESPEKLLGSYDLVFAKGRCAWESLASGTAVIVCDSWGVGPMVTLAQLDYLRARNFGRRLLQQPFIPEVLEEQIRRYNAADAGQVSQQIRATAGLDGMVDRLVQIYGEIQAEHHLAGPAEPQQEMLELGRALTTWWNGARQAHSARYMHPAGILSLDTIRTAIREEIAAGLPLDSIREVFLGNLIVSRKPKPPRWKRLLQSIQKRLPDWASPSRRAA